MTVGMAEQTVRQVQAARPARRTVAAAMSASLVFANVPLHTLFVTPASAQANIMTRVEYEACQARDDASFRQAIEGLTLKGLQTGLATVDYKSVVADSWRQNNMDDVIDRQVDASIAEVSEENSYWSKASSLFSKDKAQALATSVAERVFKSESVKRGLENLATGVGGALGKKIELAAADTAEPAMTCLQAFLGPRYGSTVARVVSRDAGKEYTIDSSRAQAGVSTGQVLSENAGGIAGAVILIVRRQLSNMASRVGARVVGSVLSRLVSVVAGGIGVVLIAKDIWDLRNGVLPIIATEMKSSETKKNVQAELAKAMQEQIGENLKEIASKTAERVLDVWSEFRRAHAKVLELADKNTDFKRFLESLKPESLPRLDEVVALILAQEGEGGILKRLADGTLNTAVNQMSGPAYEIARESRSIETALKWSALAGDKLPEVVANEVHRRAGPDTFSKASLTKLLALSDKVAITRLAALKPEDRAPLFELPNDDLKGLGRSLTEGELSSLSRYITTLDKSAGARLLSAVAQTPSRMQVLGRPSVRDAILASKDQSAAVGMMLRSDVVPDPWMVAEHAQLAYDGKVSPWLLWEKHPVFVGAAAFFAFVLLAMMKRMLFGRRQKVIIQRVPAETAAHAPPIKSGKNPI
ncbi:MAG: hypothetical protein ABL898_05795 [Hyphomicrobiaceae bacterium]